MKCPHCLVMFHEAWTPHNIGKDTDHSWSLNWTKCAACGRWVMKLIGHYSNGATAIERIFNPQGAVRPVPKEVPVPFSTDFTEAAAVLPISAKASAAISRRLLQHTLKEKGGATKKDLVDQIDELLPKLPGHLQDLHAIRQIGNFAAHPSKDKNTGEIVEVEPGEAEWLLDILERMFDFYFVQPEIRRKQIIELNAKLKAAGKPELPVP
jgi:hypothetical protein